MTTRTAEALGRSLGHIHRTLQAIVSKMPPVLVHGNSRRKSVKQAAHQCHRLVFVKTSPSYFPTTLRRADLTEHHPAPLSPRVVILGIELCDPLAHLGMAAFGLEFKTQWRAWSPSELERHDSRPVSGRAQPPPMGRPARGLSISASEQGNLFETGD